MEEEPGLGTKPCPFCGFTDNRIESQPVHDHVEYAMLCLNCGAFGPSEVSRYRACKMWDMRRLMDEVLTRQNEVDESAIIAQTVNDALRIIYGPHKGDLVREIKE